MKKWFFCFKMKIDGEDALGEHIKHEEKVEIGLFASTEDEALQQADYIAEEIKATDQNGLKKYCAMISSDDTISFSDFRIMYIKELKVEVPEITM